MAELDGKVAIVTGGGRGIGRAHALALARAGAAVLVNDLGGDLSGDGDPQAGPVDEVAETIRAAGGRAAVDTSDISDWDAVGGLVQAALDEFGRLDIVLNNAGISRFATIDAVSRHDWERTIAVNLTGTAALCHFAGAHWRERGPEAGRRIINTSSGVGLTPVVNNPMYVASKAGVAALTIACAQELADLGVRANALAPVARSRISKVVAGPLMDPPSVGFDAMDPENVARVGAFLASPRCRFTGRVVGVIGDSVQLWEGWSVGLHLDNGGQPWSDAELADELLRLDVQHRGQAPGFRGLGEYVMPTDEMLEELAAIEGR